MSKATAICTCKKCGCDFVKSAIKRNTRESQCWERWAVSYYDTCDECMIASANKVATEQAIALALPPLIGSDKQVAWATTLRSEAIAEFRKTFDESQLADRFLDFMLNDHTEASWWIDNRLSWYWAFKSCRNDFLAYQECAERDSME